jgi:uncharacterized protein (TIGR02996 family)
MTEADFLAGIAAHPAELERWLVLADWLEDQGDPRAELARLRYLLHTEPDHPERAQRHARQLALLESGLAPVVPTWTNSLGMELALILPGSFWMGSPDSEEGHNSSEVRHLVTLAESFYLGVFPVTVGEFGRFIDTGYQTEAETSGGAPGYDGRFWKQDPATTWRSPGFEQTDRHPVVCISWNDAQAMIAWLNEQEKQSGLVYSLPTEAQWEYACRAGSETAYWWGADASRLDDHAWFSGNSGNQTYPVDTKTPNSWGLFHMQGNVWEWGIAQKGTSVSGTFRDPLGDPGVSRRLLRGASWSGGPVGCRSAFRGSTSSGFHSTTTGLRLAAFQHGGESIFQHGGESIFQHGGESITARADNR